MDTIKKVFSPHNNFEEFDSLLGSLDVKKIQTKKTELKDEAKEGGSSTKLQQTRKQVLKFAEGKNGDKYSNSMC